MTISREYLREILNQDVSILGCEVALHTISGVNVTFFAEHHAIDAMVRAYRTGRWEAEAKVRETRLKLVGYRGELSEWEINDAICRVAEETRAQLLRGLRQDIL